MKLNTQRLSEELFRRGMSQRDLGDRIGVTDVSVSRYVHGKRSPRERVLLKMAAALGVTPEYLTGTESHADPSMSFNEARMCLRMYCGEWTKDQKIELVRMILNGM